MLVLRDGKIQQHVTLQSHRQEQKALLAISFSAPLTAEQEEAIAAIAGQRLAALNGQRTAGQLSATHDPAGHHELLKALIARGIPVCGFALEETSLQSLYLETARHA
jgi:hypothetical protein